MNEPATFPQDQKRRWSLTLVLPSAVTFAQILAAVHAVAASNRLQARHETSYDEVSGLHRLAMSQEPDGECLVDILPVNHRNEVHPDGTFVVLFEDLGPFDDRWNRLVVAGPLESRFDYDIGLMAMLLPVIAGELFKRLGGK